MPAEINDKISIFVKDQFPQFYKEDGPIFEAFVEAYYEYLEQTGQTLDFSRNLIEYQDIDTTTADFLEQFKKLYLEQLPGLIKSDDRLTIKHIMDFYRAKGSERSIQLLFRILFDEAAVVNKPGEDVLKPSTSELIDWLNILIHQGLSLEKIDKVPFLGTLMKTEEDFIKNSV